MKRNRTQFLLPGLLLGAFLLWTAGVCLVDVRPIGPLGSMVGFAGLNGEQKTHGEQLDQQCLLQQSLRRLQKLLFL